MDNADLLATEIAFPNRNRLIRKYVSTPLLIRGIKDVHFFEN